jgi:H+/Cl- antiporter ClcA
MFFKVIAMASTNAAGGVGGTFAPSLFVGAFTGATLALVWAGGECAARLAGGTAFSAPGGLTAWRRLFGHY